MIFDHTRDCPSRVRSRRRNGIRPLSTRSPSLERTAGSTVSEPRSAIATTSTVPTPNEVNTWEPIRNIPVMAMITVNPEIRIARPEVAAATSSASSALRPLARSSRSRRR